MTRANDVPWRTPVVFFLFRWLKCVNCVQNFTGKRLLTKRAIAINRVTVFVFTQLYTHTHHTAFSVKLQTGKRKLYHSHVEILKLMAWKWKQVFFRPLAFCLTRSSPVTDNSRTFAYFVWPFAEDKSRAQST